MQMIKKKDTDKIESVGELKVQVHTNTLGVFMYIKQIGLKLDNLKNGILYDCINSYHFYHIHFWKSWLVNAMKNLLLNSDSEYGGGGEWK